MAEPITAERFEWPRRLCCPISHAPMLDPVVNGVGQTYDRADYEAAMRSRPGVDPMTRERLKDSKVVPNIALRSEIRELATEHGAPDEWRDLAERGAADADPRTLDTLFAVGIVTEGTLARARVLQREANDAWYEKHQATEKVQKSAARAEKTLERKRKHLEEVVADEDKAWNKNVGLKAVVSKFRKHLFGDEADSDAGSEEEDAAAAAAAADEDAAEEEGEDVVVLSDSDAPA